MTRDDPTAGAVVEELRVQRRESELPTIRKRLAPGEDAIGMRMRDLFAVAKAHTDLSLAEVDRLLDEPAYEPRMAAFCILDFKARRRIGDDERLRMYELYLDRHDRITTWDMVDRSAPRVVGGHLTGRDLTPLFELARADEPLRRRTAITAPLLFVAAGSDEDLGGGFELAALLAADDEPVVHNAVGTFLKHAGSRAPGAVLELLDARGGEMARSTVRLATEKLDPAVRERYRRPRSG